MKEGDIAASSGVAYDIVKWRWHQAYRSIKTRSDLAAIIGARGSIA